MGGEQHPPLFWREAFVNFAASLLMFNSGLSIGWSSPALASIETDEIFSTSIKEGVEVCIGE